MVAVERRVRHRQRLAVRRVGDQEQPLGDLVERDGAVAVHVVAPQEPAQDLVRYHLPLDVHEPQEQLAELLHAQLAGLVRVPVGEVARDHRAQLRRARAALRRKHHALLVEGAAVARSLPRVPPRAPFQAIQAPRPRHVVDRPVRGRAAQLGAVLGLELLAGAHVHGPQPFGTVLLRAALSSSLVFPEYRLGVGPLRVLVLQLLICVLALWFHELVRAVARGLRADVALVQRMVKAVQGLLA